MYGLVLCGVCRRPRIADKSKSESTCPYCGATEKTKNLVLYFESPDQDAVREALSQATGFVPPDGARRKRRIEEADPYSTMVYRYEHCSDLDEKMEILAEGLTEMKGEFTLEDVESVAGKRAEKMLAAMLDRCMVTEVRPGVYRA